MADVEAEIRSLEDRRYRAMLDGDLATLSSLLSDHVVYTHSNGMRDDKAAVLDKIRSGYVKYVKAERPEENITVIGDTALVYGRLALDVLVEGAPRPLRNLFLVVWARENGAWKLVAYQPTPIPG